MTIKRLFPSFVLLFLLNATAACAQEVTLVYDETVPQEAYAARKLGEALEEQGYPEYCTKIETAASFTL
ncbi:hypothetical protein [Marinimicrobium koreense]|uniref:hypothetical protein n=1 Tax=Marinimicrobium koreense TaxID=306545 RepID=UPI003F72F19B